MSKLSLEELKVLVAEYVDETHIGTQTFAASRNNLADLVDKIGKIVTIDGLFADKLPEFDGEDLPLGKTVEEWYQDLILPTEYDENGPHTMDPAYPTYRKPCYSESLGRRQFKTTIKYNTYERACNNADEAQALINMVTKRLFDSFALWRYGIKKQILAGMAKMLTDKSHNSDFVNTKAYHVGDFADDDNNASIAVCVKEYPASTCTDLAEALTKGYFVNLSNMIREEIVDPTKATGAEQITALKEFIKEVKADVESASFATEGYSFNGNTVGAEEGLLLIVKKGLMPLIEVEIQAGAFQLDKLALPAKIKVIDEFPGANTDSGVYAMLIDPRGVRLHNDYQAIREQMNGDGDFQNYTLHTENTAFVSRNTFVVVYKDTNF